MDGFCVDTQSHRYLLGRDVAERSAEQEVHEHSLGFTTEQDDVQIEYEYRCSSAARPRGVFRFAHMAASAAP